MVGVRTKEEADFLNVILETYWLPGEMPRGIQVRFPELSELIRPNYVLGDLEKPKDIEILSSETISIRKQLGRMPLEGQIYAIQTKEEEEDGIYHKGTAEVNSARNSVTLYTGRTYDLNGFRGEFDKKEIPYKKINKIIPL